MITIQKTLKTAGKIGSAHLLGGAFYACWMSAFILLKDTENPLLKDGLWLLAPIISSLGFTLGVVIYERIILKTKPRFFKVYPFPLIGTACGAFTLYWFGPMLIVFGLFFGATLSIVVRERFVKRKRVKNF